MTDAWGQDEDAGGRMLDGRLGYSANMSVD
jgi:hypothetical protein